MRVGSRHISLLTLICFSLGGLVAPVLHQVQHGVGLLSGENRDVYHEHPDYDAVSDNTQHLQDNELDCALCSLSLVACFTHTFISVVPDHQESPAYLGYGRQILHGNGFHIKLLTDRHQRGRGVMLSGAPRATLLAYFAAGDNWNEKESTPVISAGILSATSPTSAFVSLTTPWIPAFRKTWISLPD